MIDLNDVSDSNLHRTIALEGMVTALDALINHTVEGELATASQVLDEAYNMLEQIQEMIDE